MAKNEVDDWEDVNDWEDVKEREPIVTGKQIGRAHV